MLNLQVTTDMAVYEQPLADSAVQVANVGEPKEVDSPDDNVKFLWGTAFSYMTKKLELLLGKGSLINRVMQFEFRTPDIAYKFFVEFEELEEKNPGRSKFRIAVDSGRFIAIEEIVTSSLTNVIFNAALALLPGGIPLKLTYKLLIYVGTSAFVSALYDKAKPGVVKTINTVDQFVDDQVDKLILQGKSLVEESLDIYSEIVDNFQQRDLIGRPDIISTAKPVILKLPNQDSLTIIPASVEGQSIVITDNKNVFVKGDVAQDTVYYELKNGTGIDVNLEGKIGRFVAALESKDYLGNAVRNVVGSQYDDVLRSGLAESLLAGRDGDDLLIAGKKETILDGGSGDDTLYGVNVVFDGSKIILIDNNKVDILIGGLGQDTFYAGKGDIIIDDGLGNTDLQLEIPEPIGGVIGEVPSGNGDPGVISSSPDAYDKVYLVTGNGAVIQTDGDGLFGGISKSFDSSVPNNQPYQLEYLVLDKPANNPVFSRYTDATKAVYKGIVDDGSINPIFTTLESKDFVASDYLFPYFPIAYERNLDVTYYRFEEGTTLQYGGVKDDYFVSLVSPSIFSNQFSNVAMADGAFGIQYNYPTSVISVDEKKNLGENTPIGFSQSYYIGASQDLWVNDVNQKTDLNPAWRKQKVTSELVAGRTSLYRDSFVERTRNALLTVDAMNGFLLSDTVDYYSRL